MSITYSTAGTYSAEMTMNAPSAVFAIDYAPVTSGCAPYYDPDFGLKVDMQLLRNRQLDEFQVHSPIEITTYFREGTFASRVSRFPMVAGFASSIDDSRQDAIDQLLHLRRYYGSFRDDECTSDAAELKNLLAEYLVSRIN